MPRLEIIVVPLVEDQQGKVISSTRIREGEIDINGKKLTS
jgi:phosphopantetheine adenylyltransferase